MDTIIKLWTSTIHLIQLLNQYSDLLQTLILAGALFYAYRQIKQANIIAVNERAMAHLVVLDDVKKCNIIAELEKLKVPTANAADYWAARAIHLAHLNLLWQVWELSGRPQPKKNLSKEFNGWQEFAKDIVAKSLKTASKKRRAASDPNLVTPADSAAADIWEGLESYEIFGSDFYKWLASQGT